MAEVNPRASRLGRGRPGVVALAGLLIVVLTPFALFPEIMGDAGVTDASPWRNGAALGLVLLGAVMVLTGSIGLVSRRLQKRGPPAP